MQFKLLYLPNGQHDGLPICNTSYHTISLCENRVSCIHSADVMRSNTPIGFKTATSSGRSIQKIIGTKQPGKWALTLHSGISVMENVKINEQNKSISTRPLYVHAEFEEIWANCLQFNVWRKSWAQIKQVNTLHSCISVMDKEDINSDRTHPLRTHLI